MTPEQAAERLGTAAHHVADITEHGDGHIVTLASGAEWLVTDTVTRPYVADVDGERTGEVAAAPDSAGGDLEDEERTTEPAPKPARSRRGGKSS